MHVSRRSLILGFGAAFIARPALALIKPQIARPYWSFPGTYLDFDFKNFRYYGGIVTASPSSVPAAIAGSTVNSSTSTLTTFFPQANGLPLIGPRTFIPRVTIGYGLWAEDSGTNIVLQNRDLTNAAWVKVNVTALKNQPGADGSVVNTASSITATATLGTILQAITLASAQQIGSVMVKRLVGTGTLEFTVDGGVTWTTLSTTTTYTRFNLAPQTVTNPSVGFRIGTSGDSFAIDLVSSVTGNSSGVATSLIPTTTVAVTRGNEEPTMGTISTTIGDGVRIIKDMWAQAIPFGGYVEMQGNGTGPGCFILVSDGLVTVSGIADGGAAAFAVNGQTVTSGNTGTFGLGNINRVAFKVDGSGASICLNGGAIVKSATVLPVASPAMTHMGIGNHTGGVTCLNGATGRLALWRQNLPSDGAMVRMTTAPA